MSGEPGPAQIPGAPPSELTAGWDPVGGPGGACSLSSSACSFSFCSSVLPAPSELMPRTLASSFSFSLAFSSSSSFFGTSAGSMTTTGARGFGLVGLKVRAGGAEEEEEEEGAAAAAGLAPPPLVVVSARRRRL